MSEVTQEEALRLAHELVGQALKETEARCSVLAQFIDGCDRAGSTTSAWSEALRELHALHGRRSGLMRRRSLIQQALECPWARARRRRHWPRRRTGPYAGPSTRFRSGRDGGGHEPARRRAWITGPSHGPGLLRSYGGEQQTSRSATCHGHPSRTHPKSGHWHPDRPSLPHRRHQEGP